MFTWIPIHEETAKRLLQFKDRNHELVDILARMNEAELKATPINDQGSNGTTFQLKEIDPFSFLANFNRGTKDSNRIAMWQVLKDEWQLSSDVPMDFDGLPIANAQNSWLMPYAKSRSPEHVPLLWKFFEHIMSVEPESLDADLMQQCLDLPKVGITMLTMGMFWSCPEKWMSTDGKNIGFASTKGVSGKPGSASEYLSWLPRMRAIVGGDGVEFSRKAHLWATNSGGNGYGSPFNRMFPPGQADPVLAVFADVLEVISEEVPDHKLLLAFTFGATSRSIPQLVINIGMWAILWYENDSGGMRFNFLLPMDHPEMANQGVKRQFAKTVGGKGYGHARLTATEFLERYDELWPDVADAMRVACRLFTARKGTPYIRHHREDLVLLATDQDARPRILSEGLIIKHTGRNGNVNRRYWLLAPGESAKYWEEWLDQNIASIGWEEIGDLSRYPTKKAMTEELSKHFTEKNQSGNALMLRNFSTEMKTGDIIFGKLGRGELLGWGEIQGEYGFDSDREIHPNILPVEWEKPKAVKLPEGQLLAMKTLTDISKNEDLLKILAKQYPGIPGMEGETDDDDGGDDVPPPLAAAYTHEDALAELFMSRESLEHILEQLKRKKNIILQGAPGVGKTFIAKRLAWLLLGAKDQTAVEMIQFHQSYTYEDFVQGLRPTKDGHFAVKDGCFYRLCRKALANPKRDFFLVIDEINRGNLSKILGELMMLIETDKRGQEMTLAYSEEPFTVPPNLYLIGTMNTADRSLSLVDYALRRRFAFLTLDPGFSEKTFSAHLEDHGLAPGQTRHIIDQLETLNQEIEKDEANLGRGYRIGHSFFTPTSPIPDFRKWYLSIVRYEIIPLLEEYWIDNPKLVQDFRNTLTEGLP